MFLKKDLFFVYVFNKRKVYLFDILAVYKASFTSRLYKVLINARLIMSTVGIYNVNRKIINFIKVNFNDFDSINVI